MVKNVHGKGKKPSKPKTQNQFEENMTKSIRKLFKLKKENKAIKDRTIRDIKTLLEEEDDYYKPTRLGDFWNNNYMEYESDSNENKNLSVKEYLDEIKLYLRHILINLQKSGTWKVQLIIAITLFLLKMLMKSK